ncbi:MAG: hypothetical protein COT84_02755 [Chlamydiae bacterium CG10_big_fil_rev_8_21_14_0_10_35_9]|nr:MAG: hypothetical protein COT84_02755 [Chlamydiae bacterium CG10_big_fil_rev_8_21_14_0_10_35_9]
MKSFIVLYSHKNKKYLTEEMVRGHISFLKKLKARNILVICGPFIDNERAMVILRSLSKIEVDKLVKEDPFVKEKYYEHYEIAEFIEANQENDWLMSHSQTKNNNLD